MVRVVFLHPDLGIGGAERLVVDAALALKRKGHEVQFFTAHHDSSHCFPETHDGQLKVTCVGDWLPRSICGKLAAFWAYVRMVYVALYLVLLSGVSYDVVFVDQVSACIPFLRLKHSKVIFYCHFPDQLLTQRKSLLKKIYRYVLDNLEERTTSSADCVLVNSHFTAGVYLETFRSIKVSPSVLHPSLDFENFDKFSDITCKDVNIEVPGECLFLSLNRYERKKNLGLALESLKVLFDRLDECERANIHLIMAGGYDDRVQENIEHYKELLSMAKILGISDKVTFLKSPSDKEKIALLRSARCLIYTPDKEHFGIVPIESMYVGTPVIAVESGGPKETIVNGVTGFLCSQNPEDFAEAMYTLVKDSGKKQSMGKLGHDRVVSNFSFAKFSEHLDYIVQGLMDERKQR
ncbi:alpha-1,3/1,6-mannosyltransferase ALG2 [Macrobrachium rosenbergii]|uniref:alpha-1,3/1,6-mannosyltransferase ALG2 n=1 Tax=Macrobrachium rosenbergii TaxID=79674 RepID=UPI0034D7779F